MARSINLDDEREIQLEKYKIHNIEAVVDRLVLNPPENEEDEKAFRSRLTDSVETALKVGEGYLTIQNLSVEPAVDLQFSEHLACPEHGVSLPEIEPRTFSFNTPHGACPDCQGLGSKLEIDPDLIIPDHGALAERWRDRRHGMEFRARPGRVLLAAPGSGVPNITTSIWMRRCAPFHRKR